MTTNVNNIINKYNNKNNNNYHKVVVVAGPRNRVTQLCCITTCVSRLDACRFSYPAVLLS